MITVQLDTVCSAIRDCPHSTPKWQDSGIRVITSKDIKNGRLVDSSPRFTSTIDYIERTKRASPQPGDLILTREAPMGEVCLVPEELDCCLGQRVVLIKQNLEKINGKYLLYAMQCSYVKNQIQWNEGTGSTVSNLRIPLIHRLTIPYPPKKIQDFIAAILGALDDKIDLNRRMNETLEAMARAIFKDWFVDFGPTRAKMEGRAPYLAREIWDLFPDRLDDEGKPEGWELKPLAECFEIIGGGTPKTSVAEYWGEGIPWFSVVDTPPPGCVFVVETEKSITYRGLKESSARLVPAGTTIISARGTVGNLAMTACDMAFNQSCYALRGDGGLGDSFVFLAAQHMVDRLKSMAHGSVFSTITRQTFEAITLSVPGKDFFSCFENMAAPSFMKIKSNVIESRTLAQTRDLLLPKLMSGEIRVKDAEKTVENIL